MPAANTLNDVHSNSTKFSTKKLYSLFLLFILQSLILHAQSLQDATLIGRVTISENEGLAGVNVFIDSLTIGTATDSDGYFELKNIPSGNHIITFSAIGYKEETRSLSFQRRERKTIIVNLTQTAVDIDEVEVTGRKQAAVISTDAVQATVLQADEVYKQAVATQDYLRRTSGVHIRQQGGLGSETAVNLNGLTGNAIRIYYDGVPLEYFGGGIELNNFPVSLIRRVEVYKGIMPIAIGSDALGGGINLIPRTVYNDFLEVSHEAGAFNTHRSTLLYRKSMNSTTVLGSNVFFNYSDNDYIMKDISTNTFEIEENIFGRLDTTLVEKVVDAKRFHNRHLSIYGDLQLSLLNRTWADRLDLTFAISNRDDQRQNGQRITRNPGGEATSKLTSFIQMLKYEKSLLFDIDLNYFGTFSYTRSEIDDSTRNTYDWEGNILPFENERGSEILGRPSLREGDNTATSHRILLTKEVLPGHRLTVNNFFAFSRIEGNDPVGTRLMLGGDPLDPNTIPADFYRNISGIELKSRWLNKDALETTLFGKYYLYDAESIDIFATNVTLLPVRKNRDDLGGFGAGIKYSFNSNFALRGSFERTLRIPTEGEIFGNFGFIVPNYTLDAEESDNLNAGFVFNRKFGLDWQSRFDANVFSRVQRDLIRLEAFGLGELAQFINEDEITASGLEFSTELSFRNNLRFSGSLTFQELIIAASENIEDRSFIDVKLPNIPDFFWNISTSYTADFGIAENDNVDLFYNLRYVDPFSVTYVLDEDNANPQNIIPSQYQHDLGFTYNWDKAYSSITLQINNLLDAELFDNYRVPKPGRYIALKVTFSK